MSDNDRFDLASQPNDAFFKDFFSDVEPAKKIFKGNLCQNLASQVIWPTLALMPGSFVKQSLQQSHSDLLFSGYTGDGRFLLFIATYEPC